MVTRRGHIFVNASSCSARGPAPKPELVRPHQSLRPMIRFHIPLATWAAHMVFVPPLVLLLFYLGRSVYLVPPSLSFVLVAAVTGFSMVLTLFVCELRIDSDGLVLYRSSRLEWPDVTDARVRSFCGLPHLYVKHRNALPWWIPLYYRGPADLREALRHHAPEGNPVRAALA